MIVVFKVAMGGLRAAFEKLGKALTALGREWLNHLAREYRKTGRRVPGSMRTKRLRKKRATALAAFGEKQ